jgi:hypothetical protein
VTQPKSESQKMTMTEPIQQRLENRRLPAAVLAAYLFQIAAIVFWAGTAAERISVLERDATQDQPTIERVAVLEAEIAAMRAQVSRIEAKVDQIENRRSTP